MNARFRFGRRMVVLGAFLTAAAIVASTSGSPQANAPSPSKPADDVASEGSRVIAIKFHADWCPLCQKMGSAFEDLQKDVNEEPVLYVTFDHTDDFARRQSQYLAHAMGLQTIWKEHGGTTGYILLIDAGSHKVIQKLTHDQGVNDMSKALQGALKSASEVAKTDHPRSDHPEHPKPKSDHPEHPE